MNNTKVEKRLIAIENLDGAGGSTQSALLSTYLAIKGYAIHTTVEPTDTPIGKLIRSILCHDYAPIMNNIELQKVLINLFVADRRVHLSKESPDNIHARLTDGHIVICNRYIASNYAYNGVTPDLQNMVLDLNKDFIIPGLTIFVDIHPREAIKRIKLRKNADIFETEDILRGVQARYYSFFKTQGRNIAIVDTTRSSVEDTQKQIQDLVTAYLLSINV